MKASHSDRIADDQTDFDAWHLVDELFGDRTARRYSSLGQIGRQVHLTSKRADFTLSIPPSPEHSANDDAGLRGLVSADHSRSVPGERG